MEVEGSAAFGSACPTRRLSNGHDFRRFLHSSSIATVEDASVSGRLPPPRGFEPGHQVVLPYFGLFAYSVGRRRWLIDANKTLLISPGWQFEDEHPVAGLGHAAVLINPARDIIEELCGASGPKKNSAFLAGALQSTLQLRLLTQWMLSLEPEIPDALQKDEWVVRAIELAVRAQPIRTRPCSKIVERAKEFLHAYGCEPISLEQIARNVDVSPIYLTQEFTRSEGMPLYRYQLALRLSHALLELRDCENITALALDLGFSNHSHFTHLFRRAFGITPSKFREAATSSDQLALADRMFDRIGARRGRRAA